jgi:hypothetical protein
MLGSLQLDLYLKKDVTIHLDSMGRITTLNNNKETNNKTKNSSTFPFPSSFTGTNGHAGGHHHYGSLGKLHFRLKYDLDKSDLNIHVIEGKKSLK